MDVKDDEKTISQNYKVNSADHLSKRLWERRENDYTHGLKWIIPRGYKKVMVATAKKQGEEAEKRKRITRNRCVMGASGAESGR
jgi:hypothetical protein